MQNQQDPFDPSLLMKQIDLHDWKDAESSQWAETPSNSYYQFSPPKQYEKYYRLFRVMLNQQQSSKRCFDLTTLMLKLKLNNYYALMLRKDCLGKSIPLDKNRLVFELQFVNDLLSFNSKEYQLWTYKKHLFRLFEPNQNESKLHYSNELTFLQGLLELDSKNYHVWDYKLWLTKHFHKEEEQLQWSEHHLFKGQQIKKMVEQQLKQSNMKAHIINWTNCYSMWSYRFNLADYFYSNLAKRKQFHEQEIGRAKNWLSLAQNDSNECAWNYFTGLVINLSDATKEKHLQLYNFAQFILKKSNSNRFAGNACLQLLQFLQETYNYQCKNELIQLIHLLTKIDSVRQQYYRYLLEQ